MTRKKTQSYGEHWKRVGPLLEEIHREELRQFSHSENAQAIDDLLAAGLLHAQPRVSSGLLQMQRIFAKARK
jgi:hypothetical protein